MLLQIIDERWREHLHDMDYLREGIHLRGFAQIEPLVAYKNEGFGMFTQLMNAIWEEFARYIFVVEIEVDPEDNQPAQSTGSRWGGSTNTSSTASFSYAGGTAEDQPSALAAARQGQPVAEGDEYYEEEPVQFVETRTVAEEDRVGRNDPCPCGSGKKYKKCHGAQR